MSLEQSLELLYHATLYCLPSLEYYCARYCITSVDITTATSLWNFAVENNYWESMQSIADKCFYCVLQNLLEYVCTRRDEMLELHPAALERLLRSQEVQKLCLSRPAACHLLVQAVRHWLEVNHANIPVPKSAEDNITERPPESNEPSTSGGSTSAPAGESSTREVPLSVEDERELLQSIAPLWFVIKMTELDLENDPEVETEQPKPKPGVPKIYSGGASFISICCSTTFTECYRLAFRTLAIAD